MPHAYTIDVTPRPYAKPNARPPTSASAWSSSTTSTRNTASSTVTVLRDDPLLGFAGDAASFLSGSWMKKNKPSAQRSRKAPPVSLNLARISDSSSPRRSVSSRDASSRPQTSQTTTSYAPASVPSSPGLLSPRRLTPFASFTSLRSNGDISEPKKKNRLLSFKITTPKVSSRSTSPQPSSSMNNPSRLLQRDVEEADAHDRAMQQLPADIKPAARKLLGIEVHGSIYVQRSGAATMHTGMDSSTLANVKPFARRQRPLRAMPSMDGLGGSGARSAMPSTTQSPLRNSPHLLSMPSYSEGAGGDQGSSSYQSPLSSPSSPQLSSRPSRQLLASSPQTSFPNSPQLSTRPSRQSMRGAEEQVSQYHQPQLSSRPSRQSIREQEEHKGQFYQPQLSSRPSRQSMRTPSMSSAVSDSTLRGGAVSPITGQTRPEHPLEAEARIANSANGSPYLNNIDSYFQTPAKSAEPPRTTFYSDSSEGEGEDDEETDGLRSSGYSLASSQTSYGIASPIEPDTKSYTGGLSDWALRPSAHKGTNASSNTATRWTPEDNNNQTTSTHHQQSSTSSAGSNYTSGSSAASSAGAVRSFSRPFTRPAPSPLDTTADFTNPRQAPPRPNDRTLTHAIGIADGQPYMQLEAITEDSPEVSDNDSEPVKIDDQEQFRGHRRHASGSRNFSRPQVLASPKKQDPDTDNVPRSSRTSSGLLDGLNTSRITDVRPARPLALAFQRSGRPLSLAFESARPLSLAFEKESQVPISAASAESVILRILEGLDTFEDLFVAARLNKGFLAVFKKNELRLMKNALRNMSPAQWELREASPKEIILRPANGKTEYSPNNYLMFQKRDSLVVESLKLRLLKSCRAQLRPETIQALGDRRSAGSGRMEDAFWRVWTFCTIFGCDSRRYSSLEDQIDWLHGGEGSRRHNRQDSLLSYSMSNRAGRPSSQITSESFGRGNFGGLSLEELDDMLEIWDALKDLLWSLTGPGCVAQAKTHGVFDAQRVVSADKHAEQAMLEEWAHWLATQGLSVIADLAADTNVRRTTAFITAKNMDWTNWDAPTANQTRGGFLRVAIERAQEAKLVPQASGNFAEDMPISVRRKSRGHELAAQLREKERGFDLEHASTRDDKENFFDLWLAWTNKAEAKASAPQPSQPSQPSRLSLPPTSQSTPPPRKPLPTPPVQPHQPQRSPPTVPASCNNPVSESGRPAVRPRSSNNSLSLFPPQYKTRMTPSPSARGSPTSTPMRSRQNSIVKESDSIEQLKIRALKQARLSQSEKGMFVEETFSSRLSVCPEA